MSTLSELDRRLAAAGIALDMDPIDAWCQLRRFEGPAATIIDLYELEACRRGVAAQDLPAADRYALASSVMPEIWPDWNVTSGSARAGDVITIAQYDPTWPERYVAWREVLCQALGPTATRIEHVGSTSVPGLASKPIIDIQVSVTEMADEEAYVPQLEGVGLQLRSRDSLHRYFRPFPGRARDVHVHVCDVGSQWEAEHLRFRDLLRTRPDARVRYAQAKRDAARLWADDGLAYTDAKTAVIISILEEAGEPR